MSPYEEVKVTNAWRIAFCLGWISSYFGKSFSDEVSRALEEEIAEDMARAIAELDQVDAEQREQGEE